MTAIFLTMCVEIFLVELTFEHCNLLCMHTCMFYKAFLHTHTSFITSHCARVPAAITHMLHTVHSHPSITIICTYFPHSLVDYLSSTTPYTSCSSSLLNCLHIVHTPLTPLLTIYHQPLHTHLVHYHYSIVCTLYRVVTLLAVMALEGSPYMDTSLRMRISS